MNDINDGGYGVMGNMSMDIFLKLLTDEQREKYENHLKKQDKIKYTQFKEWQK